MKLGKWRYEHSGAENWCTGDTYDTKEDAITAGRADPEIGDMFDVGQQQFYSASDFVMDADGFLEYLDERAYDTYSEFLDGNEMDFVNSSAEFEQKLKEIVDKYIGGPTAFLIEDIETVSKTADTDVREGLHQEDVE